MADAIDSLMTGFEYGKKIRSAWDDRQVRNAAKQGLEDAKAARDADINGAVVEERTMNPLDIRREQAALQAPSSPNPAAAGGLTMRPSDAPYQGAQAPDINTGGALAGAGLPQQAQAQPTGNFMAVGKKYATQAEAHKAAEANADSLMSYFNKNSAPKIQEMLVSQGRLDQAKQFGEYMDDNKTKEGMQHWAKGVAYAEAGDYAKAADSLTKAQNVQGYGTGTKIASIEPNKDGQGVTVNYETEDGKKSSHKFDSIEDLTHMGISALNPTKQFEYWLGQKKKADEIAADAAKEKGKQQNEANADARKAGYKLNEIQATGVERRKDLQTKADLGLGDGTGTNSSGVRAAMSDRDAYMNLYKYRMENDIKFARMSPQQQQAEVMAQLKSLPPAARAGIGGGATANGVPLLKP